MIVFQNVVTLALCPTPSSRANSPLVTVLPRFTLPQPPSSSCYSLRATHS